MKYIITVLLVIPLYYSTSLANNFTHKNTTLTPEAISGTIINALEEGDCSDGSIELEINNENGPFNIEWSNGANTASIDQLVPGEYCVTVTDELCGEASGCWEVKCCPFTLDENQFNFYISHPACEGQQGYLDLYLYDVPEDAYPLSLRLENSIDFTKYDYPIYSNVSNFKKLSLGNYNAQIIYGDGCSSSFEFKILFQPIEIQFEKTAACDEDGTIDVIANFGKLPYSYTWSDDPSITVGYRSGLSSGFYNVTVEDTYSCSASASVYIKKGDAIKTDNMSVFIGPSDCFKNTGVIEISKEPEGGSPPYQYVWSNGASGKKVDNLAGGDYFLTIYDVLGCTANAVYTVPIFGQPVIYSEAVEHTCGGQNFGEIGVLANSATGGNVDYSWSNGSTDFIIDSLSAGLYSVTITDVITECSLVKTYEIENLAVDPLTVSETVKNICSSEGSNTGKISLKISGGVEPYEVVWSTGETGFSISDLSEGEYSATITDKCGTVKTNTYTLTSVQLEVNIETNYPNFEEVILETKVNGGTLPYSYLWNTGEETFFKVDENEGTHSVTVTDQNGCSKSEEIEVICDPVNFAIITTGTCVSTFKLKIGPNTEIGPGPFLVKIEKKINQQFKVVDFRQFATTLDLLNYEFVDSDLGTFRASVTNYCGFNKTETFNTCIDCDYDYYNIDDDFYVEIMGGLLDFKLDCPCSKDCGFLGLTTDKVKLLLDQTALQNFSNEISGFPNFEIIWPEGSSTVFHSANSGKFEVNGPTEYVLDDTEFDNGITVSVSASLPFGIGEVCSLNIPIEFGKEGINGYFKKWDNPGLNPFVNHDPPYNWATVACAHDCTVPTIEGVLYENEPVDSEDEVNYNNMCSGNFSETQVFFYEPNNYNNPCQGGGSLYTHYESVIGVVIGQKTLLPNVAIDQHPFWPSQMLEEQDPTYPYTCPPHTYDKGYCLFDSKDVYGEDVILRDPIIASYCKDRVYDPPIDTDGDGLPDVVDPWPLNPDILCIDDDNNGGGVIGGGGGGGGVDENGCQTTFLPNDCQLAKVCPGEEPTYVDGIITTESYSGIEPCVHCFSVDVCRVIDPDTGEEYVQTVGPVIGDVDITLGDIPECGNVCAILFHCSETGQFLGYLCAANCQTTNNPLCGYSQIDNIIASLLAEDGPTTISVEMTDEIADNIIYNHNDISMKPKPSVEKLITIPNPSKSEFTVQFESQNNFESNLEIRNTYSELVHIQKVTIIKGMNSFKINKELASGLYIISLKDNDEIFATKHVVHN